MLSGVLNVDVGSLWLELTLTVGRRSRLGDHVPLVVASPAYLRTRPGLIDTKKKWLIPERRCLPLSTLDNTFSLSNYQHVMASRAPLKTTFEPARVLRPIFTGGAVALDNGARILASTLGEDAVLTDPRNGQHLAQIEGVSCLMEVQGIELTLAGWRTHLQSDP